MKRWRLVIIALLTLAALSSCNLLAGLTATLNVVTYNGNHNTGGSAPVDSLKYVSGQKVTVLPNSGKLVKSGASFSGWNTKADGGGTEYSPGAKLTMGSTPVTLYAKWATAYTVIFNGNFNTSGSVPVDSTTYLTGQTVTVPGNSGNLTKSGYTFLDWNTKSDGTGIAYTATYAASVPTSFTMGSSNVVLYADWGHNYTFSPQVVQDTSTSTTASDLTSVVSDPHSVALYAAGTTNVFTSGGTGTWGNMSALTGAPSSSTNYVLAYASEVQTLFAAPVGSGIYPYTLGPVGWGSPSTSWSTANWTSIACDTTGVYVAATDGTATIYLDNFGTTTETTVIPATSAHWSSIASDSTGKYLVATDNAGGIWASNNYGVSGSWTQSNAPSGAWSAVASSSTGQYLVASVNGGGIWTSSDYGASWVQTIAPSAQWTAVAADSTGQYLAATANGGTIWTSTDFGWTWNKQTTPASMSWKAVAVTPSAAQIVAVAGTADAYVGTGQ